MDEQTRSFIRSKYDMVWSEFVWVRIGLGKDRFFPLLDRGFYHYIFHCLDALCQCSVNVPMDIVPIILVDFQVERFFPKGVLCLYV